MQTARKTGDRDWTYLVENSSTLFLTDFFDKFGLSHSFDFP